MIFNMSGGGNQMQIVDFSLSSSFVFEGNWLIINNVKLARGKVRGFLLKSLSGIMGNMAVIDIYGEIFTGSIDSGQLQGNLMAVYYDSTISNYYAYRDLNSNAFIYNPTAETLQVKVALSDSYLPSGNYRLVIW